MIIEWHDRFDPGDIAWVAAATLAALVLVWPGLLLFYGALRVGREAAQPVSRWLGLLAVLSLAWSLWIYTFAFGPSWGTVPQVDPDSSAPAATDFQSMMRAAHDSEDTSEEHGRGGYIGGTEYAALQGVAPRAAYPRSLYPTRRPAHHLPHMLFLMFHLAVFIAFSSPLLVALSERLSWTGVAVFALLWGTLVYAPLCHWIWGEGWLSARGAVDSSGGLLHVGVGISALIGSFVLGRGESAPAPGLADPSAGPLQSFAWPAGAALVWAGLPAVHAGLFLSADGHAASALLNSHLAASAGLIAWYVAAWLIGSRAARSVPSAGALAGLAAIAPGCGLVMPQSALIVGAVGGGAGALCCSALCRRLPYRSGRVIFAVQGFSAAAGLLLTGVFVTSASAGFDRHGEGIEGLVAGDMGRLASQGIALGAAALLAGFGTLLIAAVVRPFHGRS